MYHCTILIIQSFGNWSYLLTTTTTKAKNFNPTEKYRNTVHFAPMGVDQTQKRAAFSTPGYS
nr:MAG TPA: hypothetical protein [Caudoviricetes sp.]